MTKFLQIRSISQLHQMVGYEKPRHPLVTVLDYSKITTDTDHFDVKIVTDFYLVSMKSPAPKGMQYGRQHYDFEEGTLMFLAPGQVFSITEIHEQVRYEGWSLWFHPDLIAHSSLGRRIREFTFFSYAVNEALHLSEDEKNTLKHIVDNIQNEYNGNLDKYSQSVIITAIEQLLNYSQRFYGRQFLTRKKQNTDMLASFEQLVVDYFSNRENSTTGLPTVEYLANRLKTTKEYLQIQLIETAKHRLLNSNNTVNEIAYSLGFEYPQYFNRLFKSKTGMTPGEYRKLN